MSLEELPTLFQRKEDMTEYFRGALDGLAKDPNFGHALQRFDGEA